jgi:hypothetical protein
MAEAARRITHQRRALSQGGHLRTAGGGACRHEHPGKVGLTTVSERTRQARCINGAPGGWFKDERCSETALRRARTGERKASAGSQAGRSGAVDWAGQTAGAYGFTFGSPAGSVFVGCEMAGGSEDGNESSSDLSSSLSISSWLLCAVCPCPPSSRCRSFPPSRLVVPPWFAAIALTPLALVAEVSLSRAPHCNCAWSEGFQKPTVCDLKAAERVSVSKLRHNTRRSGLSRALPSQRSLPPNVRAQHLTRGIDNKEGLRHSAASH